MTNEDVKDGNSGFFEKYASLITLAACFFILWGFFALLSVRQSYDNVSDKLKQIEGVPSAIEAAYDSSTVPALQADIEDQKAEYEKVKKELARLTAETNTKEQESFFFSINYVLDYWQDQIDLNPDTELCASTIGRLGNNTEMDKKIQGIFSCYERGQYPPSIVDEVGKLQQQWGVFSAVQKQFASETLPEIEALKRSEQAIEARIADDTQRLRQIQKATKFWNAHEFTTRSWYYLGLGNFDPIAIFFLIPIFSGAFGGALYCLSVIIFRNGEETQTDRMCDTYPVLYILVGAFISLTIFIFLQMALIAVEPTLRFVNTGRNMSLFAILGAIAAYLQVDIMSFISGRKHRGTRLLQEPSPENSRLKEAGTNKRRTAPPAIPPTGSSANNGIKKQK